MWPIARCCLRGGGVSTRKCCACSNNPICARDPDDLAHHAVNARLWPEALRYLQQAAVAAAERAGYPAAEQHLRHALKIAELLPQDRTTRTAMVEIMVGLRSLLARRPAP